MPLVRRSASSHQRGAAGGSVNDPAALKRWPDLCEFLSAVVWPDGAPRQPGSLSVFVEDGRFKAALHDRDQSLSAYLTSDALLGLLDGLEKHLKADDLDWRPWREKGGLTGRKK